MPETKVSSLINLELGLWKSDEVQRLFLAHEASLVLGIPLSLRNPIDREASGKFITSGAYKLLVASASTSLAGSSDHDSQRRFWRGVWQLRVPNKIKHFIWRACNNALPTKCNLVQRHIVESELCEL